MQEQRLSKKQGFKMKGLFLRLSILSLFLLPSLHALELNWGHDYEKALLQAQKEDKMVYLFIGADKCRHYERFKKQTLSNKEVINTMKEDYILLYMSRDQHKIPYKFELYGAPRHYFLNAKGDIIADGQGSREIEGWYDILDEVVLMEDKD
jgi:thioredoxin-related protein